MSYVGEIQQVDATVVYFDSQRGYGWVRWNGPEVGRAILHAADLRPAGHQGVQAGDIIRCQVLVRPNRTAQVFRVSHLSRPGMTFEQQSNGGDP